MKKYSSIVMLAAVAAVAFVSCNKEVEVPVEEPIVGEGINITVVTSEDTKTTLSEVTDASATAVWQSSDQVGFINGDSGVNVASSSTSLDGTKATFTGTVPSAGTYYAYYPYSNEYDEATQTDRRPNEDGVMIRIPNNQTAAPNNFDPKADVLVSEAFTVAASGENAKLLRFRRLSALLQVYFIDGTTGSKITGKKVTSVSVEGENNLVGRYRVHGVNGLVDRGTSGLTDPSGYKSAKVTFSSDFDVNTDKAYIGIAPQTLASGSTLKMTVVIGESTFVKTVTLGADVKIGAGDILPLKVTIKDSDFPVKIERVWGKYSTSGGYWNTIAFGGTASTDRNIAMDDEYIYLPETTGDAKLWMIPLDGITAPTSANVEGVSGGTHALSCVRVVPNTAAGVNGGKDFLMACNLTTSSSSTALTVYSWNNGTSNPPVSESVTNGRNLRLGDKFTVYGSLQDGALFFRNWNKASDEWGGKGSILVLRMAWSAAPSGGYFNPRVSFSYEDTYENPETLGGINAYYPYPGDASNGFIANVSSASKFASYSISPLSQNGNDSGTFMAKDTRGCCY